jgi:hypothetical protein
MKIDRQGEVKLHWSICAQLTRDWRSPHFAWYSRYLPRAAADFVSAHTRTGFKVHWSVTFDPTFDQIPHIIKSTKSVQMMQSIMCHRSVRRRLHAGARIAARSVLDSRYVHRGSRLTRSIEKTRWDRAPYDSGSLFLPISIIARRCPVAWAAHFKRANNANAQRSHGGAISRVS